MQDKQDGDKRRQSAGDFLGLKTPSKAKDANLHDAIAEEAAEEAARHLNALRDPQSVKKQRRTVKKKRKNKRDKRKRKSSKKTKRKTKDKTKRKTSKKKRKNQRRCRGERREMT